LVEQVGADLHADTQISKRSKAKPKPSSIQTTHRTSWQILVLPLQWQHGVHHGTHGRLLARTPTTRHLRSTADTQTHRTSQLSLQIDRLRPAQRIRHGYVNRRSTGANGGSNSLSARSVGSAQETPAVRSAEPALGSAAGGRPRR
jgi:hypothetical protein